MDVMTPYVDSYDLVSISSTGNSTSLKEYFNYAILVFQNVSPYGFSAIGLACCIGPSVLGAAW